LKLQPAINIFGRTVSMNMYCNQNTTFFFDLYSAQVSIIFAIIFGGHFKTWPNLFLVPSFKPVFYSA
jgi:hypothetical protein